MTRFPARKAQIEWNETAAGEIAEVFVFDLYAATPADLQQVRLRYSRSHGACKVGWMDPDKPRLTPEGQFVAWTRRGFASPEAMLSALQELGKIEEADFARTLAVALHADLAASEDEPATLGR